MPKAQFSRGIAPRTYDSCSPCSTDCPWNAHSPTEIRSCNLRPTRSTPRWTRSWAPARSRGFSSAQTVAEQIDDAVRGVIAEEAQQIVRTLRGGLCATRKQRALIGFDRAVD